MRPDNLRGCPAAPAGSSGGRVPAIQQGYVHMKIGVAREIKQDEYRVALTHAGARELIHRGHEVVIETGAGEGSAISDDDYVAAGASIADVDTVWGESEMVLKVKEPLDGEYQKLSPGQVLFTYLHLAAAPELTRGLVESGATAIAYETVETPDHRLPLLAPMSEVAGRLSAQVGAYYLMKPFGGRGRLMGGVAGGLPAQRAVRAAGQGAGAGRRHRRVQRRADRPGHAVRRHHLRAQRRPHARARRQPGPHGAPADVQPACHRGGAARGRPGDRWGADPGREGPAPDHPRDAGHDEGGVRARGRCDRPGRLLRDLAADDAHRSHIRRRRRAPLLRREHAGSGADHVDRSAHERHAALR